MQICFYKVMKLPPGKKNCDSPDTEIKSIKKWNRLMSDCRVQSVLWGQQERHASGFQQILYMSIKWLTSQSSCSQKLAPKKMLFITNCIIESRPYYLDSNRCTSNFDFRYFQMYLCNEFIKALRVVKLLPLLLCVSMIYQAKNLCSHKSISSGSECTLRPVTAICFMYFMCLSRSSTTSSKCSNRPCS